MRVSQILSLSIKKLKNLDEPGYLARTKYGELVVRRAKLIIDIDQDEDYQIVGDQQS
jgi:hypothetical protein